MYPSEKIFIMKFIATLKKIGVSEIPYSSIDKGAESMRTYFQSNRGQLGKYANELAMLFLKSPLGGTFSEFKEGIERQNGGLMTFDNPHYVHAIIHFDDDRGVDFILNQNNIDITNEQIHQFALAFCDGAGIDAEIDGGGSCGL